MTDGLLPFEFPHQLPLMVLPDCNLFPHCLLPLYIFEPKYREMLREVMDSHRMFCIGTLRRRTEPEAGALSEVYSSSTAGLVRACVTQDDGCSNLLLQGMQRIRIVALRDHRPYRIAEIDPLPSVEASPREEVEKLDEVRMAARALAAAGFPISSHVTDYLDNLDRLESLVDIVTYHFVTDAHARQPFLEEPSVTARSDLLTARLRSQLNAFLDDDSSPPG